MSEEKISDRVVAKCECGGSLYEGDMFCGNCGAKVNSCAKCGSILSSDAVFCHKCGYSLALFCKGCGAKILDNNTAFCPKCGKKVGADLQNTSERKPAMPAWSSGAANNASDNSVPEKSDNKLLKVILIGCGAMIGLVIVGFFFLLVLGVIVESNAQENLTACKSNLKNIAIACEMYATDNAGRYPPSLDYLTRDAGNGSGYLKIIPECPAAGKDTYSGSYMCKAHPDCYFICCSGCNHSDADLGDNLPAIDGDTGMVETGVEEHISKFK